MLCSKLRQFSYEEIEFFLPQLCHLVISIDNESMALEEFIIDLCEESVNGALLVGVMKPFRQTHTDFFRPFGYSRPTSTIFPPSRPRKPFRHAEGCITKCRG